MVSFQDTRMMARLTTTTLTPVGALRTTLAWGATPAGATAGGPAPAGAGARLRRSARRAAARLLASTRRAAALSSASASAVPSSASWCRARRWVPAAVTGATNSNASAAAATSASLLPELIMFQTRLIVTW